MDRGIAARRTGRPAQLRGTFSGRLGREWGESVPTGTPVSRSASSARSCLSKEPHSLTPTQPKTVTDAVRAGQTGRSVEAPVEKSARRGAEAGLRWLPPPLLSEPQDATGDHVRPLERRIPRRLCPSAWVEVDRETVSRPPADEMRKPLSNRGGLAVERLPGSLEVRAARACPARTSPTTMVTTTTGPVRHMTSSEF
jgi:hypothetical protein